MVKKYDNALKHAIRYRIKATNTAGNVIELVFGKLRYGKLRYGILIISFDLFAFLIPISILHNMSTSCREFSLTAIIYATAP